MLCNLGLRRISVEGKHALRDDWFLLIDHASWIAFTNYLYFMNDMKDLFKFIKSLRKDWQKQGIVRRSCGFTLNALTNIIIYTNNQ